jgi:hypothetical protein
MALQLVTACKAADPAAQPNVNDVTDALPIPEPRAACTLQSSCAGRIVPPNRFRSITRNGDVLIWRPRDSIGAGHLSDRESFIEETAEAVWIRKPPNSDDTVIAVQPDTWSIDDRPLMQQYLGTGPCETVSSCSTTLTENSCRQY